MATEFYYQVNGRTLGPVNGIEIRDSAVEGVIDQDSIVKIGESDWVPASKIRGLFDSQGNPISHESYSKALMESAFAPKPLTHIAEPVIPHSTNEDTPVDSSKLDKASSGSSSCSVRPDIVESLVKPEQQQLQSSSLSVNPQQISAEGEGILRRENLLLGYWLGIPAILFLLFIIYWFGFHDSWEIDNYSQIDKRCKAVLAAIQQSNDDAAEQAYTDLNIFIGERTFEHNWIAQRVDEVHQAYVPVNIRIKQARLEREARELAEKQREDLARAEKRIQKVRETVTVSRSGKIDWAIVEKARSSWNELDFRSAGRAELENALAIIVVAVNQAVPDPLDRAATLDHIQRNIDSW